jgi:hypothetical protein
MRRLMVALLIVFAVPVVAAAAKSSAFALGTYHGKTSLHGEVTIRIYEGHCDKVRQNTTQEKGYCFAISRLTPVPRSVCSDSSSQSEADQVTLAPYGTQVEQIHLAATGRYRDSVDTYSSGPKPLLAVSIEFVAKHRTVTGTVRVKAGGNGQGAYACTAPVLKFTAQR